MAVSDSFLEFVLEQLDRVRQVSSRRMFGGVGLYSEDIFFAVLDNDTLFFKVDEVTSTRYREHGMPPFQPMPNMAPMLGYYQVPPVVLEDRDAIVTWAAEAITVGRRMGAKKPKPRGRKKASRRAGTRTAGSRSARPKKRGRS